MDDAPTNPDRDDKHRRRREAGRDGSGEEDPDGRAVAAALYGGDLSALEEETGRDVSGDEA